MSLQEKMLAVMDDMNEQVVEREELIEAIAIALLTRKNLFILGAPGQAKSFAINQFRARITGRASLNASSPSRQMRTSFSAAWIWQALSPAEYPRQF